MRRLVLVGLVAIALSTCGGDDSSETTETTEDVDPQVTSATVDIVEFAFEPANITVPALAEITWTNTQAGERHTIKSQAGAWDVDSGVLEHDETFTAFLIEEGTYTYTCGIHPFMEGTITVSSG